jgi:hypothetical protein
LLALFLWGGAGIGSAAPAQDCATEAQVLSKVESELPRLDIASPQDKPPYCITLETIIAFAARVKAHVAQCPQSRLATAAADWSRKQTDYSKLFVQRRCKRTL